MSILLNSLSAWPVASLLGAAFALGMGCASPSPVESASSTRGGAVGADAESQGRLARAAGPLVALRGPSGRPVQGAEVWVVDPGTIRPDRAVIASRTLGDWVKASRAVASEVATSGGDGQVQFTEERKKGLLVVARRGALFGMLEWTEPTRSRQRVEMDMVERRGYTVQVVDAAGAPAVGVPLTLAAPDPGTPGKPFALASTAVTDDDGLAMLYEPPAVSKRILQGLDQVPERVALLRLPMLDLAPIVLPEDGRPVRAVLPPTAPLEVRCRHAAFDGDHWAGILQVFPAADGSRSERTLAQTLAAGRAQMPHVSPTEDLRMVVALSEAEHPSRFIGTMTVQAPGSAALAEHGAARVIELPLDTGLLVTGRCVDAAGASIANKTVDLSVVGDANSSWTLVTDAEGRFLWWLQRPGKTLARIVVGVRSGERGAGAAGLRATQRLGDVTAGQVVDLGVLSLK